MRRTLVWRSVVVAIAVLTAAADGASAAPVRARLLDVPYFAQTGDLCGAAAVAMVLRYWGASTAVPNDFAPLVDHEAGGISASRLAAAVRSRGWQALTFDAAQPLDPAGEVDRGHPVIALIDDGAGPGHYVVIVAWTADEVVVHDPARRPFLVMTRAAFAAAWAAAGGWGMVVLPRAAGAASDDAPADATGASAPAPSTSPCTPLIDRGIAQAKAGDVEGASDTLSAFTELCPTDPAGWRELAGVRFLQKRWTAAAALAGRAVALDPHDAFAWQLLATSKFVGGDTRGALEAWNQVGQPVIDLVSVSGASRLHREVIAETAGLPPGSVLTAAGLDRANRRLAALPTLDAARVSYRPIDGGRAVVDIAIVEQPVLPTGLFPLAAVGAEAVLADAPQLTVADLTGSGEALTVEWRWPTLRRGWQVDLAVPTPAPLPGVATLDTVWERQAYGVPQPGGGSSRVMEEHRRAAFGLADWATGAVHWQTSGGLDRWNGADHAMLSGGVDLRAAGDRVSIGVTSAAWTPDAAVPGFWSSEAWAAWRSRRDPLAARWLGLAGVAEASAAAPFGLWPGAGAGTGEARDWLLRAHPLLDHDVIDGPVLGRLAAHVTVEYEHPIALVFAGPLSWAAFTDGARAWRRADGSSSPFEMDLGAGLRWAMPGNGGAVRLDLATGLRDGGLVLSAGWTTLWPGG